MSPKNLGSNLQLELFYPFQTTAVSAIAAPFTLLRETEVKTACDQITMEFERHDLGSLQIVCTERGFRLHVQGRISTYKFVVPDLSRL